MRNLMPSIYRQRLIVEAIYGIAIDENILLNFCFGLSTLIGMKIVFGPKIFRESEKINSKHAGYECVVVWAESGFSLYTWENNSFLTLDIYSCKEFDLLTVSGYVMEYFKVKEFVCEPV
jgi:S-adenosylmethionine decarboxylase